MYNHESKELNLALGVNKERSDELRNLIQEYDENSNDDTISEFMEVVETLADNQREAMLMTYWYTSKMNNDKSNLLIQAIVSSIISSIEKNADKRVAARVLSDITIMLMEVLGSEMDDE